MHALPEEGTVWRYERNETGGGEDTRQVGGFCRMHDFEQRIAWIKASLQVESGRLRMVVGDVPCRRSADQVVAIVRWLVRAGWRWRWRLW